MKDMLGIIGDSCWPMKINEAEYDQQFFEEGFAEGRSEGYNHLTAVFFGLGYAQGRAKAARQSLAPLKLMLIEEGESRFGPISAADRGVIDLWIDWDQVEELHDDLDSFSSWAEVLSWAGDRFRA